MITSSPPYPNPDDPGITLLGVASDPKNTVAHFPTKTLGQLLRGEQTAATTADRVY